MIPVFIPYVNRPDLLRKAVASVPQSDTIRAVVLNNSQQEIEGICSNFPTVPLTFAQTQNWMLKEAEGLDFYLFMHSDAEAGPGTVEGLGLMARSLMANQYKWGAIFTAYDALAAFNVEAMNAIGGWDEGFEWYAGDADCYRRLRLAGYPTLESNLPVKHTPSQTLNSDPEIRRRVDAMFHQRVKRYIDKWGGDIGHEIFTKPFNSDGSRK